MQSLWLDYRRPPPGRQRPGLLLLAAGAVAAAAAFADYVAVAGRLEDMQAEVARLQSGAARPLAAERMQAESAPEAGAPAHAASQWEALFASLEAAGDESVTLLGLHPASGGIQITGEAKNYAASLDYVQRLQAAPGVVRAQLTQSEVVLEHPRRPVRFALVAQWPQPSGAPK